MTLWPVPQYDADQCWSAASRYAPTRDGRTGLQRFTHRHTGDVMWKLARAGRARLPLTPNCGIALVVEGAAPAIQGVEELMPLNGQGVRLLRWRHSPPCSTPP